MSENAIQSMNEEHYRNGRRAVSILSTDLHSIAQALEVYEQSGDAWAPSFKYGYLDGIDRKLNALINEVRAEAYDVKHEEDNNEC